MMASFTMRAIASPESLAEISRFILEAVRGSDLDEREAFHLMMAADEACTNIIKYGRSGDIEIKCDVEDGKVEVEIVDDGVPFDPLKAPPPDIDGPLEERKVGGLGIYFIRALTDYLRYERRGGKNVLTMTVIHSSGADPADRCRHLNGRSGA
jgi:anti-sigma regulatory factor (Ser/Thr protein kinase)